MSPAAVAVSEPMFELPRVWDGIAQRAPVLAQTVTAYLENLCARLAPRSVVAAEVCLRDFSLHVITADPSCRAAREVTASHVAAWCATLAEREVTAETINYKLDVLRRFFEHLRDGGHPDAPAEVPIARRPRLQRPSCSPAGQKPAGSGPQDGQADSSSQAGEAQPGAARRDDLGGDRHPGASDGGHHVRVSGSDHGLSPAGKRGGLLAGVAPSGRAFGRH